MAEVDRPTTPTPTTIIPPIINEFNCCLCIDHRMHTRYEMSFVGFNDVALWQCQSVYGLSDSKNGNSTVNGNNGNSTFFVVSESAYCIEWASDNISIPPLLVIPFARVALFFITCFFFLVLLVLLTPDCIWSAINVLLLVLSLYLINRLYPIRWSIKSSSNPVYIDECAHVNVMIWFRYACVMVCKWFRVWMTNTSDSMN